MPVMTSPTLRTVAKQKYRNGRWGDNTASVVELDGEFLFFNGYGDPWGFKTLDAAMSRFTNFLADKIAA